jgi:hypothetical protein
MTADQLDRLHSMVAGEERGEPASEDETAQAALDLHAEAVDILRMIDETDVSGCSRASLSLFIAAIGERLRKAVGT